MKEQLYKKVFIHSESDLPKNVGDYFVRLSNGSGRILHFPFLGDVGYTIFKLDWMRDVEFWLQPQPEKTAEEMFMQFRDLTDEEWLKLPKEEILQLYKNCYQMLTALKSQSLPNNNITIELEQCNPYPESVFTPIPDKELKKIIKLLKDNGYSTDCLYGNWGRTIWGNCVNKFREILGDYAIEQEQSQSFQLSDEDLKGEIFAIIQNNWTNHDYPFANQKKMTDEIIEYLKQK